MSTKHNQEPCPPLRPDHRDREKSLILPLLIALGSSVLFLGWRIRRLLLLPSPKPVPHRFLRAVIESPQAGLPHPIKDHERSDAKPKWIFACVLFLGASVLAIHGITARYLGSLKAGGSITDQWQPVRPSLRVQPAARTFPLLQVSPPMDLHLFEAREDQELNTYRWINRTAGVVRLPIERAMTLVLQEAPPTRTSTNANGPSAYQLIQDRLQERQPGSEAPK